MQSDTRIRTLLTAGELRQRLIDLSQREAVDGLAAVATSGVAVNLALASFRDADHTDTVELSRQVDAFSFSVRQSTELAALHGYGSGLAMSDVSFRARRLSTRLVNDLKALAMGDLANHSTVHPGAESDVDDLMAAIAATMPQAPKDVQTSAG